MTHEEMITFEIWHSSQKEWHATRLIETGLRWHLRQYRWHRKQLCKLPLNFIVTITFRKYAPRIAENVTKNNYLLRLLSSRAKGKP
jgi:hypothetical protein